MSSQRITVNLSDQLYQQIHEQAQVRNHTVEDELIAVVRKAFRQSDERNNIPEDIENEVEQLQFLDDEHLWRAAKSYIPTEYSDRIQWLSQKNKAEGLTKIEKEEVERLRHFAHRVMLVRAKAAVLLKERGHDISSLRLPVDS